MWAWLGHSKEHRETERLLTTVKRLQTDSHFSSYADVHEFITDLLVEVIEEADVYPAALIVEPMTDISLDLLLAEPFCVDVGDLSARYDTLDEGMRLRRSLRRATRILERETYYLDLWRAKLKIIWRGIIKELPVNALVDPYPDGTVPRRPVLSPVTPLATLIENFPNLFQRLIGTFFDEEIAEPELFHNARLAFEKRVCAASGIAWNERHNSRKPVVWPTDQSRLTVEELSDCYTKDTSFAGFFSLPVPIPVPNEVRFEHTHIIGGTGHGKTQLLQYLINDDLERALHEKLSVVVIDPDGTLQTTLSRTIAFRESLLGQRAIFIDPTDNERPVGLNLFDVASSDDLDQRAKETVENNTIELFEYFFDALLGSELTSRQATLFRYLGLLLMHMPNANIHTLRELMEDGERFKPYMAELTGTARTFFETRFFDPSLKSTKQQILARLWGVLSNRSLDRVFSATKNTVQLDQAMQDGKIIFVNTSKEYLGEEGSHIFARMIVALIGQGLIRRAALPPEQRTPTYIYIDEAEGVVDQTLVRLLAQVRKYKGAITLAHQHLDQLSTTARAGVLANTSIKLAGGVSANDAVKLAPEFRVERDFILAQRKEKTDSHFALFAKNITPQAMSFPVPLGYVERIDRLSEAEHEALLARSRERYGWTPEEPEPPPVQIETQPDRPSRPASPVAEPDAAERISAADELSDSASVASASPVYRKEGGGGARHREIQLLLKELGEGAGYRASLEEVILDGEGRVDVILRRDEQVVCCEVSVTTTKEHELLNVQKCLRFEADAVWVVAATEKHRLSLERFLTTNLSDAESRVVSFFTEDELGDQFADSGGEAAESERIVRGYRVKSSGSKAWLQKQISRAFDQSDQHSHRNEKGDDDSKAGF